MNFMILGLASKAPNYSIDQAATADMASELCCSTEEQKRLLKVLYRRSRIQKRSLVLLEETKGEPTYAFYRQPTHPEDLGPRTKSRMHEYEKFAGKLVLEAAHQALESGKVHPQSVTHLITVSCTGFYAPGLDSELIEGLGLPATVARAQLGFMGCHAVLNALQLAGAISGSDPNARVLIASVELCSLHFQYGWDPDTVVSNALFSDGAGAIVGGSHPEGHDGCWQLRASGSRFVPESKSAMSWRIGNHGFLMTLSPQVPKLIKQHLPGWVDEWLGGYGMDRSQIKSWAIHPGGPRLLSAARESLGISKKETQVSEEILAGYGNMSSATMIFILSQMVSRNYPLPCVALGFGPGLTMEGALFV